MAISDKFAKELQKFFLWANENHYVITNASDGEVQQWNEQLLQQFYEPARNKLETYIKELLKTYSIAQTIDGNVEEVDDHKILAKDFKQNKRKTKRKRTTLTDSTTTESESANSVIIRNDNIDSSKMVYIDTLPLKFDQLVKTFGDPIQNQVDNDDWRLEWKININQKPFSVYDWKESGEFQNFQDSTFHICGNTDNDNAAVSALVSFVQSTTKSQRRPRKQTKKETTPEPELADPEPLELNSFQEGGVYEEHELFQEIDVGFDKILDNVDSFSDISI